MSREKVSELIKERSINNRLSCEEAHVLSRELNVPLQEIGRICNEMKIKISSCQLGCF